MSSHIGSIVISILFFSISSLSASEMSGARLEKMAKKGALIASRVCDSKKLSSVAVEGRELEEIASDIERSGACRHLGAKKSLMVASYLSSGKRSQAKTIVSIVPHDAKCPVCGMFVYKYPKWAAMMVVSGKKHFFDGVKDMMKFYIFDGDFPYDREKIESMKVSDFYTLEPIDAKKAWYVMDSDIYGPMGNELIPFKDRDSAEDFITDHKGKIVRFEDIDGRLVMGLDGIGYE